MTEVEVDTACWPAIRHPQPCSEGVAGPEVRFVQVEREKCPSRRPDELGNRIAHGLYDPGSAHFSIQVEANERVTTDDLGAEAASIRGVGREMPGEPCDERVLEQCDVRAIAGDGPEEGRDRHDADIRSLGR